MEAEEKIGLVWAELLSETPEYDKISELMSSEEELVRGTIWIDTCYLVIGYFMDENPKPEYKRAMIRFMHFMSKVTTNMTAEMVRLYNKE